MVINTELLLNCAQRILLVIHFRFKAETSFFRRHNAFVIIYLRILFARMAMQVGSSPLTLMGFHIHQILRGFFRANVIHYYDRLARLFELM